MLIKAKQDGASLIQTIFEHKCPPYSLGFPPWPSPSEYILRLYTPQAGCCGHRFFLGSLCQKPPLPNTCTCFVLKNVTSRDQLEQRQVNATSSLWVQAHIPLKKVIAGHFLVRQRCWPGASVCMRSSVRETAPGHLRTSPS